MENEEKGKEMKRKGLGFGREEEKGRGERERERAVRAWAENDEETTGGLLPRFFKLKEGLV